MQGIQILTALPTGKEPTGGTERKKNTLGCFFLSKTDLPGQRMGYFIKYWKKVDSNLQSRVKENIPTNPTVYFDDLSFKPKSS